MAETELTQGQWRKLRHTQPWKQIEKAPSGDDYPAICVSHTDALEFATRLTYQERAAGRLPTGWIYSLPTEAQWEYACRAGTQTQYSFGDDPSELGDHCWFKESTIGSGDPYAHEVGQLEPNSWGLYDMHGNLCEWCFDVYLKKLPGGVNPIGPSSGRMRAVRGGSWFESAKFCRSGEPS